MIYENICKAKFISRPNRFIALAEIEGEEEVVHIKNTGRLKELLIPGSTVYLNKSDNPNRKTKFDLICVQKNGLMINIDSTAPNTVMKEWLMSHNFENIIPEYRYGNSRLDFYFEKNGKKFLMEVKGCTLEENGAGLFPDAPTKRGAKHLKELAKAVNEGYECVLAFVVQIPGINSVKPNYQTDPGFTEAYFYAQNSGVKIACMSCIVSKNEIKADSLQLNTDFGSI